jgi:hypothetical protein
MSTVDAPAMGRRDDVVEEAVVLVVRDQQRRPAPHVRIGGERVQALRDVPGAVLTGQFGCSVYASGATIQDT